MNESKLPTLVEHLFRQRYGDLVSGLCRVLGPGRLDLVEDVVQEAMVRALARWPAGGVPDRPDAWLFRVARNLAVDSLRRGKIAREVEDRLASFAEPSGAGGPAAVDRSAEIADDTLRMMFTCAHPAVPLEARVPLVLKTVGGFGVREIAAALLTKEGTIAQRLTRAKARLQRDEVRFEVPAAGDLPGRLELVLQVLYLMFSEGYRAHRGADLVREDVLEEAVRLGALLLETDATRQPETRALLALMLFLGSRIPARVDGSGELVTLADQDRSRWRSSWIQCGFDAFRRSIGGDRITPYHIEASIAATHAAARTYEDTDWAVILREYDRLLRLVDTPIVRLNRAVAVAKVHGASKGLRALQVIERAPSMIDYFLLPATIAHMRWSLGDFTGAAEALQEAMTRPCSEPERRLLRARLAACQRGDAPPRW